MFARTRIANIPTRASCKVSDVVRSALCSAVALPMSRAVRLHMSLVSPIALHGIFREKCANVIARTAHNRLAGRPRGQYQKFKIAYIARMGWRCGLVVDASLFDTSRWS